MFIDVTWGAGGITKDLTLSICEYAQVYLGVEALMHLTLTGLTRTELRAILVCHSIQYTSRLSSS
jgi:5,10-methylenetetrahydrofolate reductase